MPNKLCLVCVVFFSIFLQVGCASKHNNSIDRFEQLNRGIYYANKVVDSLYIKPIGVFYDKFTPPPVKKSVKNVLSNLASCPSAINLFLQGRPNDAWKTLGGFIINSTWGVAGVFSIARDNNIDPQNFGLTLYRWGWDSSSYLVLPIIGPSTVRDFVGFLVNMPLSIPYYLEPRWRNSFLAVNLINKRKDLLEVEGVVKAGGVDHYAFVREGYLQGQAYKAGTRSMNNESGDDFLGAPPE